MLSLILAAAVTVPACVPASEGGYLPTPSPCTVTIVDPITKQPEVLTLRLLAEHPKRLDVGKAKRKHKHRPGEGGLCEFHEERSK